MMNVTAHDLNNALTVITGHLALIGSALAEIPADVIGHDRRAALIADVEAMRVAADQATACSRRLAAAARGDTEF
jgi:hypothetical protein